jgi:Chromo (CHRromatin Organisation MOdifier) domain
LPIGSIPKGANQAVNEVLADRQQALHLIKEQLVKAQARMKKWADLKRSERHFKVGDWVYLKLQPYKQVTIQGKGQNHKLKPRFYGPYEIITKMGTIAYELNLPPESQIHPVFHVPQLKRKVGPIITVHSKFPIVGPEGKMKIEPEIILKRWVVKKNNRVGVEVLVQWANLGVEDATWEDWDELRKQFPGNSLEDKTNLKGWVLSDPEALVTVIDGIDEVKRGKVWKRSGEITQIGLGLDKEIDQVGETQRPIMGKPVRRNGEVEGVVTGGVWRS